MWYVLPLQDFLSMKYAIISFCCKFSRHEILLHFVFNNENPQNMGAEKHFSSAL